jgi:O-antigen ligase
MTFIDKIIESGIIFLLIFTPLAFGGVQPWSVAVMEIVAFSIFFLHVVKRIIARPAPCSANAEQPTGSPSGDGLPPDGHSSREWASDGEIQEGLPPCHSRESGNPVLYERPRGLTILFILFAAMIALVLFQLIPLPEGLLKWISPASLTTYSTFGNAPAGAYHAISLNPDATLRELFRVLAYAAVFFVIIGHYRTKEQVTPLVKTILAMGCFLVVFAIVQKMTWNDRIFWIYPVDEALKSGAGIWGPYINRNHFAGYLGMAIPLGMGLLLYLAPRIRALPESALGLKLARFLASDRLVPYALLFLLVLTMTATLFMTFSRGGIIAFAVSSIFFARITWRRRTLRSKTGLLAILAAVLFAAVILASWDRLEERFAELDEDHISRLSVWQDSFGIVRDYPVLGTGLGSFESAYMRYQTTMPRLLFDHAHNDYVELVTDTGIVGLLLGAGMALLFFRMAFRRWRQKHGMFGKCIGAGGLASFVAIAAHSFTDFNLHIPANALLFAVISALTYAALFNVTDGKVN